ncbi:RNA polymerase II transcription factor B subunit 4 [Coemansia sp. RSA 2336]|nr:RNA polymerase II transcription factor B subunit 4 [Coemansia sp. RSA 2336]
MSQPQESDSSLLVVVLDVNASAWTQSPLSLDKALQQLIIFINAYLALNPENKLVVLGASHKECRYLFPADPSSAPPTHDIQVYEQFRAVDVQVLSGVHEMLSSHTDSDEQQSLIARALSKALCHINQVNQQSVTKIWSRILVLSAGQDSPHSYIPLMNTIFAAQKMSVLIDICRVFGQDSVFLQQAAEITNGNYLKVDTNSEASDAFAESCQLKSLSDSNDSDTEDKDDSTCMDLASDCEDLRLRASAEPDTTALSGSLRKHQPAIGNESSPARHRSHRLNHSRHHRASGLYRNRTVALHQKSSFKDTAAAAAAAAIQETIRGNTHDEPMSSMKALRIFDTVFAAEPRHMLHGGKGALLPEHDPSCKHCVSEAMVTTHQAAAKGIQHGSHGELRMNLGNGRNAVYTDMSKVEFGICVNGWRRLVFKTVNDAELARRELSFYRKIAGSRSDHLIHLVDDFTDNQNRQVMVFPRKVNANLYGHDLFDIAYIARQLFTALKDLHELGIAHLDITPTNLMSEPNDPSHIEVIDFGLACDIAQTAGGKLPSRGTCGFVAPEILSGNANDLRADIYSAGVVLGMMLQRYLPTVNLRLLGGPLVRSDTTDVIVAQLDELLGAYQYRPGQVEFVERNTTYAAPAISGSSPVTEKSPNAPVPAASSYPSSSTSSTLAPQVIRAPIATRTPASRPEVYYTSKRNYSDDDEAEALAAAYVGGASLLGSYGRFSDDEDDKTSSDNTGYNAIYSRTRPGTIPSTTGVSSASRSDNGSLRYPSSQTYTASDKAYVESDDYFEHTNQFYSSPRNTPVSYMRDDYSKSFGKPCSLVSHLSNVSDNHSSSRYVAVSGSHRRSWAGQTDSSKEGCVVGKPGRVPVAVLYAADLLRWVLQPEPQWRPTAAQALDHPFLASVKVKRWQTRASSVPSDERAQSRADSGIAATESIAGSQFHSPAPEAHSNSSEPPEQDKNLHACVHGAGSSYMVVSECNSKQASPATTAMPSLDAEAARDRGIFMGTETKNICSWESEMHQRSSHSGHGDRIDTDSNHSYDYHAKDHMSSFYSKTYDDLSSFFC